MIRILLIDDHPIVRHGVRRLLLDRFPSALIDEAGTADGALAKILSEEWDVVILDLLLGPASGFDVLKQAHQERPALPVVVLSMQSATHFARRLLAAGASAYVRKDMAPDELVGAIECLLRGESYVSAMGDPGSAERAPHDCLSDREYQVLRKIGAGQSVTDIAVQLNLSVKTVSTYRTRILTKFELKSTSELMRYAIENGLIDA